MKDIIRLQAGICKTFSNPSRMHVIKLLCTGEKQASELIKETGLSKANLSQHMSMLVSKGVVNSMRKGVNVFYSLSDPKIAKACNLMQEVVVNSIKKNHALISKIK